jgi:hypothetical protein
MMFFHKLRHCEGGVFPPEAISSSSWGLLRRAKALLAMTWGQDNKKATVLKRTVAKKTQKEDL